MSALLQLALSLIEAILPMIGSMTSGATATFINNLVTILPNIEEGAAALILPVTNLIAEAEGSGNVSSAQITALQQALTALQAQSDAIAKDDGLT
jgi:hypothetical protein